MHRPGGEPLLISNTTAIHCRTTDRQCPCLLLAGGVVDGVGGAAPAHGWQVMTDVRGPDLFRQPLDFGHWPGEPGWAAGSGPIEGAASCLPRELAACPGQHLLRLQRDWVRLARRDVRPSHAPTADRGGSIRRCCRRRAGVW